MIKTKDLASLGMVLAVVASGMSVNSVFAAGASAGQSAINETALEAQWNGQSGLQQSAISGVVAQWNASQQGEAISANYVPSGWGAPAELMIVSYQAIEVDSEAKLTKAVSQYRPSGWGAPVTLAHLTTSDSNTYAALVSAEGGYNSAQKLHR
jgi:hypothetical protein